MESVFRKVYNVQLHNLATEDKQWDYNDSLANAGGFERLPPFYKAGYGVWSDQRLTNLLRYKDSKFYVSQDGRTVEIVVPD